MLAYATVGTNNLEAAGEFYDALLGELGGSRIMTTERAIVWTSPDGAGLGVLLPFDGEAATVGNGVMISLTCNSKEQVDTLYAKVLEMGGTDEGEPGFRNPGMYMAYWRDTEGNKFSFFFMDTAES